MRVVFDLEADSSDGARTSFVTGANMRIYKRDDADNGGVEDAGIDVNTLHDYV